AGARRLAAAKALGWDKIEASVHVNISDDEALLLEIAENYFREDLTDLEKAEWFDQWQALCAKMDAAAAEAAPKAKGKGKKADDKPPQVGAVSPGGRGNKGGVREAAQQANISKSEADRLAQIAKLSDEAKAVAKETGLDSNKTVLLAAAKVQKEGG